MRKLRGCLLCAGILLQRRLFSPKAAFALVMMGIFSYTTYSPLLTVAETFGVSISPWLLPFFLSYYLLGMVHGCLCLLLFSDTGENDAYALLLVARCGRISYPLARVLETLASAFLYAIALFLLSLLLALPKLEWTAEWGILIHSLSTDGARLAGLSGVSLNFFVSPSFLAQTAPIPATLAALCSLALSAAFVGVLVGFCRLFFGKSAALAAAGVVLFLVIFVQFSGSLTYGPWVTYLSPLSWANLQTLDWSGTGTGPSPAYAFAVWMGSILLIGALSVAGFARRDVV